MAEDTTAEESASVADERPGQPVSAVERAIVGASDALKGVEAVAKRAGLTNRKGEVSKLKLARSLLRPKQAARTVLDATADELRERRGSN